MNCHRTAATRSARRSTRRQSALERIGEYLERHNEAWYAERRRLLYKALFGGSDDSNKPGPVKLPE